MKKVHYTGSAKSYTITDSDMSSVVEGAQGGVWNRSNGFTLSFKNEVADKLVALMPGSFAIVDDASNDPDDPDSEPELPEG